MQYLFYFIFFLFFLPVKSYSQNITPDEIIKDSRIDLLYDEIYYFPAFKSQNEEAVYLPLRKWDIIFSGADLNSDGINLSPEDYNLNAGIPGVFDHMRVYLGKDAKGNAYIGQITVDPYIDQGTAIALFNFGMDYGYFMPEKSYELISRETHATVWAKTFAEDIRYKIKLNEDKLVERIQTDLINKIPYKLPYEYSGNILDTNVYLVDDGLEGSTTCVDYWIAVLEQYAGVCFYNIRISPEELKDYFLNDQFGKTVYIPEAINPFGFKVFVKDLLSIGFNIIPDNPHIYVCDGSTSTGLVLPDLVYRNANLADIPETYVKKGFIEVLSDNRHPLTLFRKLVKGVLNSNH